MNSHLTKRNEKLPCVARNWQTSNGHFLYELKGHTDWVNSTSFSADGKYIVTASRDNTIKIWNSAKVAKK